MYFVLFVYLQRCIVEFSIFPEFFRYFYMGSNSYKITRFEIEDIKGAAPVSKLQSSYSKQTS